MSNAYMHLDEEALQNLINEQRKALAYLHKQAARLGENNIPYSLHSDILSRENSIQLLEETLQEKQDRRGRLLISTIPITNQEINLDVSYTQFTKVNKLLDAVYHLLKDYVEPHSYNKVWVLRDRDSGYIFMDAGKLWATRVGMDKDTRSLREAGILPDTKLETIYAKGFYASRKK
jgi:hypothetical protein